MHVAPQQIEKQGGRTVVYLLRIKLLLRVVEIEGVVLT
jgi:hypothetical protein